MTKLFLAAFALLALAQTSNAATVTCTTESRGLVFRESSYNRSAARNRVVQSCQNNRSTYMYECERNVRCSGGNQQPPNQGYGRISAQYQYCQTGNLCTYNINWRASGSSKTIVTVQAVDQNSGQKLFACSESSGQQNADWIVKGQRYIFRMYESADCYAQVWSWMAPSAVIDFTGNR